MSGTDLTVPPQSDTVPPPMDSQETHSEDAAEAKWVERIDKMGSAFYEADWGVNRGKYVPAVIELEKLKLNAFDLEAKISADASAIAEMKLQPDEIAGLCAGATGNDEVTEVSQLGMSDLLAVYAVLKGRVGVPAF